MKNKLLAVLALSALAAGCSSPEDKMRGEFLSGCAQGGADKEVCGCVFDKVIEEFDISYLERVKRTGVPSQEFIQFNVEATLQCSGVY
ncbi:hypothetical protein LL270_10035 [Pseudomonas aestusnigri]|uniref:hypothetical protein n=1 Tax=Halopseudomonas aestusnigri TaxID=857252 RepID=UPI001D184AF2|nr:hypothetical protein [Halopseudomonas aestusnigri]MCC4260994.1 hypothetical protein [Halopseudomonas aestusnigri]